ncbi:hypothetical protein H0H87_010201 [Tephrocybe sp. NHM501043]|nr:hypothetical protein H0H87_010201 [Tephrocybe sp. NHM501043]
MKSVTFVEEPTVHYPYGYGAGNLEGDHSLESGEEHTGAEEEEEEEGYHTIDSDDEHVPDTPHPSSEKVITSKIHTKNALDALTLSFTPSDLASGLSKGALAWEMGLDLDSMDLDLDLSLDLDVSPGVDLDAPLELDIGQAYVAPPRERIGGIIEEEEEEDIVACEFGGLPGMALKEEEVKKSKKSAGLKRLLSLTRSGGKTESKTMKTNITPSARLAISGPFALGSLPPSGGTPSSLNTRSLSPSSIGSSSASIRSLSRTRANSNSTTRTFPLSQQRAPYHHASLSTPATPTHVKAHSYSGLTHPMARTTKAQRRRTAPAVSYIALNSNPSPTSMTSSAGCSPTTMHHPNAPSLRQAPSLESFRSAAGRSVRSLGSIKSTASVRGFRTWLGKVGIRSTPEVPVAE